MTLSQKILYFFTLAWVLFFGVFLFAYFQSLDGIREAGGDKLGRDFINFWAGGHALKVGFVEQIYDPDLYRSFLISEFGEPLKNTIFLTRRIASFCSFRLERCLTFGHWASGPFSD